MGRLDDHAKKRIVELRKAGLSFRKIKKVLELDDIRVTPQAIYLFLKRKNVEPAQLPPASQPPPALEKETRSPVTDQAGWEDDKLWNLLQENEAGQDQPREPGGHRAPCSALGAGTVCDGQPMQQPTNANQDSIKIVMVTSLSKDGGQLAKGLSVGPQLGPNIGDNCPAPQQATASVGYAAPVTPAPLPHHTLNSKGKTFLPPARNPALIVKRKIIGRAIHLQKKANVQNGHTQPSPSPAPPFTLRMQPASNSSGRTPALATAPGFSRQTQDASTQTSSSNPVCSAPNPTSPWGGQMPVSLVPTATPQSLADKLDAVHAEVQKLAHAMQAVLERQGRLERQQEQQQRTQQEVLMALQQLSSALSPEVVPGNQPCAPYGGLVDPSPSLPNFSQFKMELI